MNPQNQKQPSTKPATSVSSTMMTDPVCGADVRSGDAAMKKTMYRGQSYSFCGEVCRQKFEADPEQYLAAQSKA